MTDREHPFAAKTEAGRKAQRSNLRPNAHTSHGVYSIERLAPLRAQHEQELAEDYPNLDRRRRALLADRLARTQLASDWIAEHGLIRTSRGEVHAIVPHLEKWASRAEDMIAVAEQLERASGEVDPVARFNAALGRLAADRDARALEEGGGDDG